MSEFIWNANSSFEQILLERWHDQYQRALKTIADADPLCPRGLLQEVAREALEKLRDPTTG